MKSRSGALVGLAVEPFEPAGGSFGGIAGMTENQPPPGPSDVMDNDLVIGHLAIDLARELGPRRRLIDARK